MPRPLITTADRRARLGHRHRLTVPAGNTVDAARSVVALHGTDPAGVYLEAWARIPGVERSDIQRAFYDERSLIRVLAMRRTMFVVPTEDAWLLERSCGSELERTERRRTVKYLIEGGIDDPEVWLDEALALCEASVRELGPIAATELSRRVPDLALKVTVDVGKKWEGTVSMTSRVLLLLALSGKLVRGRPTGTWVSSRYEWVAMDEWVDRRDPQHGVDAAAGQLLRRYLDSFGPVTDLDASWWTGWTKKKTRAALAQIGAVEVDLDDGAIGYVNAEDIETSPVAPSWVAILPVLDATTMGWKERGWYLEPQHVSEIFDTMGNAGPTIWVDGRIVGGWGQRPDGEVVYELLDDPGLLAAEVIDEKVAELTRWLDGTVALARFPTPLQTRLAAV